MSPIFYTFTPPSPFFRKTTQGLVRFTSTSKGKAKQKKDFSEALGRSNKIKKFGATSVAQGMLIFFRRSPKIEAKAGRPKSHHFF